MQPESSPSSALRAMRLFTASCQLVRERLFGEFAVNMVTGRKHFWGGGKRLQWVGVDGKQSETYLTFFMEFIEAAIGVAIYEFVYLC